MWAPQVVRSLQESGAVVRAYVRDPRKAEQLLGTDVEFAVGDLANRQALDLAMRGVDRLFLGCGNVPGQVELECGAIDAAAAAGVDRIVKLSSPSPEIDSPLIFDRWHGDIERHLLGAGVPWILLRPRTFLTNLLGYAETIRHTGMLFAPAGTAAVSFVDPVDVGSAAAAALTGAGRDNTAYTLTGPEPITFDRIALELSRATDRTIEYVAVPDDAARAAMQDAGVPAFVADFIIGVYQSQRAGTMTDTTDSVRLLTGRDARTISQFAREHAVAFGAVVPVAAQELASSP